MAQVTIYHDADIVVDVKPGAAPDVAGMQAQIDSLTTQLATANSVIAQFKTFRDAVVADANARKAEDAAKTEGQDLIDAAQGLPA